MHNVVCSGVKVEQIRKSQSRISTKNNIIIIIIIIINQLFL